jgi:hypothetical protein
MADPNHESREDAAAKVGFLREKEPFGKKAARQHGTQHGNSVAAELLICELDRFVPEYLQIAE